MVKVGIMGLTGCSGCQCEILNCEDAIGKLLGKVEFVYFPLAQDVNEFSDFDILFVEGSVSTNLDREKLIKGRERAKILVAVGTCACYGGVQSQRNDEASLEEMLRTVYGNVKLDVEVFKPVPLREVVEVDYELPGCPLDKRQFVYTVASLLNGVEPFFPKIPVCHECKLSETDCLLLKGVPCQGPVSFSGCGAPCTSAGVGCQGCRGNCDFPNFDELLSIYREIGLPFDDSVRFLKVFRGKTISGLKVRFSDEKGA